MEFNCIVIDDEPHAVAEVRELIEMTPGLHLEEAFESIAQALNYLKESGHTNVIFCDIGMPDIDGLQAAVLLQDYCDFLVYVTAHRFHGAEAYEVNASGYLLKPIKYDKFIDQMNRLQSRMADRWSSVRAPEVHFVKGSDKNSVIKITYGDIIRFQGYDNYVIIHTTKGEKITYMQLKNLEQSLLKKDVFLRIGKSDIISMNFLDRVEGYVAFITTGENFTIGKIYRPAFRDFLKKNRLN